MESQICFSYKTIKKEKKEMSVIFKSIFFNDLSLLLTVKRMKG